MTYSIVARDPETGQVGIAVASRFFACGSLVPHICASAAFASQAFVNPLWGTEGLPRLAGGLMIYAGQPYPALDLRVDDHDDPLAELRRLTAVTEERYLLFREAMGTVENFSGMVDRTQLDIAIAENEAKRAAKGIVSQSRATPLTS